MVNADRKATTLEADKPKAKRTQLTPAERIAKAEAELKRVREAAHSKDRKVVESKGEELKKLTAKRDELNAKIEKIEAEVNEAKSRIDGPVTDGVGEAQ